MDPAGRRFPEAMKTLLAALARLAALLAALDAQTTLRPAPVPVRIHK
jgi:hypothetical protein